MRAGREFMRFYIVPLVLLAGLVLTAVFAALYTFTARGRDGGIVATNWPRTLTLEFSRYLVRTDGEIELSDEGRAVIEDNGLWLQVLNSEGREVMSCEKPAGTPSVYEPYELLRLYQYGSGDYSVFLSSAELDGAQYTYLLGFPLSISKITMYIDAARYNSGKLLIVSVAALTAVLVVMLTIYSYKTFLAAEDGRRQDERAKEEWLANITHDLKTPLAPIRGYGELLAEEDRPAGDVRRYGEIIVKNAMYAEQLVDDLKLTYQLQSNMLPLKAEPGSLTRFVRELVIDLLNAPEYEGRAVSFVSDREDARCVFDPQLLRRALTNILVNALRHNRPDTRISVSLSSGADMRICVEDNGSGMTAQELEGLFQRYYRGTSTEVKAEGSGLGMAIARQIVRAHGGEIEAKSAPGQGTAVTVILPRDMKI